MPFAALLPAPSRPADPCRPLGVLPRRSAGTDGGAARRQTGQDLLLAAGLDPRLLLPQGVQEAAGPEVRAPAGWGGWLGV